MEVYLVGGAVRDKLLGLQPKDKDYVVVGETPESMVAAGYKQVSKSFPIFLHPKTNEEYALARKDSKVAEGHTGFVCTTEGVSLEEDLRRRDLTINAIAYDSVNDKYIDPCGGLEDLRLKVIRPTSGSFSEDPLRVLRAARFLARFKDFGRCNTLYNYSVPLIPELLKLSPDRVCLEIKKVMCERKPSKFFNWLALFGVFPELRGMYGVPQNETHHPEGCVWTHTMLVVDYLAKIKSPPEVVFAGLMHDMGKPICHELYGNAHGHESEGLPFIASFCDKYKIPNKYRKLAILVCKYHTKIHGCMGRGTNAPMRPKTIMTLFEATGALQDGITFINILAACKGDARGRGADLKEREEFENKSYPQKEYLLECLKAVKGAATEELTSKLVSSEVSGPTIGLEVRALRISAIRKVYNKYLTKVGSSWIISLK